LVRCFVFFFRWGPRKKSIGRTELWEGVTVWLRRVALGVEFPAM
jgi:hypothetical protein